MRLGGETATCTLDWKGLNLLGLQPLSVNTFALFFIISESAI